MPPFLLDESRQEGLDQVKVCQYIDLDCSLRMNIGKRGGLERVAIGKVSAWLTDCFLHVSCVVVADL